MDKKERKILHRELETYEDMGGDVVSERKVYHIETY